MKLKKQRAHHLHLAVPHQSPPSSIWQATPASLHGMSVKVRNIEEALILVHNNVFLHTIDKLLVGLSGLSNTWIVVTTPVPGPTSSSLHFQLPSWPGNGRRPRKSPGGRPSKSVKGRKTERGREKGRWTEMP